MAAEPHSNGNGSNARATWIATIVSAAVAALVIGNHIVTITSTVAACTQVNAWQDEKLAALGRQVREVELSLYQLKYKGLGQP